MTWKKLSPVTDKQMQNFRRLKKKTCFLVDESLGDAVALLLREDGWNAEFVRTAGLGGRSDEDVFAYAWKKNRVLLTHDHDFLDDRRFPPHRNPGVIVLPGASGTREGLAAALRRVVLIIGPNRKAFLRFKIEITQDGIWNIKSMVRVSDEIRHWRIFFGPNGEVYEWDDEEGS